MFGLDRRISWPRSSHSCQAAVAANALKLHHQQTPHLSINPLFILHLPLRLWNVVVDVLDLSFHSHLKQLPPKPSRLRPFPNQTSTSQLTLQLAHHGRVRFQQPQQEYCSTCKGRSFTESNKYGYNHRGMSIRWRSRYCGRHSSYKRTDCGRQGKLRLLPNILRL